MSKAGSLRLQKFLAECGVASRRKSEELIREGQVRVNGKVVTELGTKIHPVHDSVMVGRRKIEAEKRGVLLVNKPRGVITTKSDPEGRRTIMELLPAGLESYVPAGRLDFDSSGLVVMTNDGELAQRLTHPKYGSSRVYHVKVEGKVPDELPARIERGVRLKDGVVKADCRIIKERNQKFSWIELRLSSGKNRVIRRMMEALRHPVIKLHRVSHGPFELGKLPVGRTRKLSNQEYRKVLRSLAE